MADASKVLSASGKPKPPNAGKGRKAGTPNKVTKQLKDMILGALDEAGGLNYLVAQAHDNPNAFLTLVGKVLPLTVQGSGDKGEHIVAIEWRRAN